MQSNAAVITDVEIRIRSAAEFIGSMTAFEVEAVEASKEGFASRDFSQQAEALRKFQREFEAFLAQARTAWNYMIALSNAANTRSWLDGRLQSKLCLLHRELANTDTHRLPIVFAIRQTVGVYGEEMLPGMNVGTALAVGMPLKVTDFRDLRLHYEPNNFFAPTSDLCADVIRQHPNETVVELTNRYWGELDQVCRSGKRSGKLMAH